MLNFKITVNRCSFFYKKDVVKYLMNSKSIYFCSSGQNN